MSYLPDIYEHFERAFPNVHAAHQELAKGLLRGRSSGSSKCPSRQARGGDRRAGRGCRTFARSPGRWPRT